MLNMDEAANPTGGPSEIADARAAASGMPLADFECSHGRLPHDRTPVCGCWPQERRPILGRPILPALELELAAIAAAAHPTPTT